MITWVTVWVLTLTYNPNLNNATTEQYTYATQAICERQGERRKGVFGEYSCNFQQVPVYVPKGEKK